MELLDEKRIVRYVGQEIAAVAAVDHVVAEEALGAIVPTSGNLANAFVLR